MTGQCQRIPADMTPSPFQLEVLCILVAVQILVNSFAVFLLDQFSLVKGPSLTVELRFQMSAADE